ncbi:MAG: hypothetical protein WCI22_01540 [Actinomycetota bacterium]
MIIAVGGWRGPGATTLALALASVLAADGRDTWLVEADPAGGVLSGRLHLDASVVGGLERVAFPADRMSSLESLHTVAHAFGPLRLITAPVDPFRAHACHQPRAPWLPALGELGDVVVVDIGRVRASTIAWAVMALADAVVVVSSAEVAAAVSSSEWLHAAGRVSPSDPGLLDDVGRLCIIDAPGGVTFPRSTLLADLGELCVGWVPWDPAAVDLLSRGALTSDRGFRRGRFIPSIERVASTLLRSAHRTAEEVTA